MRRILILTCILLLPVAACDNGSSLKIDKAGFSPVGFALSPELFQKWRIAQSNLENEPAYAALEIPEERIDLRSPSDDNIDRVADRLAANAPVKSAIERSGLSVKDYVLATVALNQAILADASKQTDPAFLRNRDIALANRDEIVNSRRGSRIRFDEGRRARNSDSDDKDSDDKGSDDHDSDQKRRNDRDRGAGKHDSDKDSDKD